MDFNRVFNCNMELTLNIIGGKLKPIVIYHIGNKEVLRFGELKRLISDISERVLSRTLRELEKDNLIDRFEYNEKVSRVEYTLTEIGTDVLPILNELTVCGNKYNNINNTWLSG